ncbi:MAG: peptide chain release factor N(5)-glutamine methyltransferase, partial [Bradyrhizobium guangdongense]
AGIESPELDARLLAGAALGLDLTGLIAQAARALTAAEALRLGQYAQRRLAGEPVARILGTKEFWGLPFQLSDATLVPRPDTETVVELALEIIRERPGLSHAPRIADLGTGSGAILLALLHDIPGAFGVGTDISLTALRTAKVNATALGLAGRSAFVACSYAAALAGPFDLIVSNPPYVRSADIAELSREVRDHDPHRALDGGADGLDAYRALIPQAAQLLAPDGALIVEAGQGQARKIETLMTAAALVVDRPPKADLAGISRAVAARKMPP